MPAKIVKVVINGNFLNIKSPPAPIKTGKPKLVSNNIPIASKTEPKDCAKSPANCAPP